MTTDERLDKLEKELAHAKRRSRRLLAVVGLVVGAFALVWIVAGAADRAEAQGAGAAPSGPCRYQLAVAPGYRTGANIWYVTQLYLLDQTTGRLFKLDESKDPHTGKTREPFWRMQCNGHFVLSK